MIIDLARFLKEERKHWSELEATLDRIDRNPDQRIELPDLLKFHELYERTSADLAKIETFASEPETRRYLEGLVARAYGEIHETREKQTRLNPWRWFVETFPRTFRRHVGPFWLSLAVTIAGCVFGGVAIRIDPEAKQIIMPFPGLKDDPSERVRREVGDRPIEAGDARVTQTASIGIATWDGRETPQALEKRADAAMYIAKTEGRDRIVVSKRPKQNQPDPGQQ